MWKQCIFVRYLKKNYEPYSIIYLKDSIKHLFFKIKWIKLIQDVEQQLRINLLKDQK